MVAANVLWCTIFVRLLHHLFGMQEVDGRTILMHTDTRSLKCTFVGAKKRKWMCFACVGVVAQNVACGGGCRPSWKLSKVGPHGV